MINKLNSLKIIFFGTPQLSVFVLDEMKKSGFLPNLIITAPDKKSGRKMKLTPPPVKIWAQENNISILQPEKLDEEFIEELKKENWDIFIVSAYGKIISQSILDIPKFGTLNIHPSLLPKYRGSSPLHAPILAGDKETGVSIMLMDKEMDQGPIIAQEKYSLWKDSVSKMPKTSELGEKLFKLGGKILVEIIPKWIAGEIEAQEQNHNKATYTQKFKSSDGEINLEVEPLKNFLKIKAFDTWPKAHFFDSQGKRVIIKKARLNKLGELVIDKVIPEGGTEINFSRL